MISFQPYGDAAILIDFEQRIDPEINLAVVQLADYLRQREVEGVIFIIPAYCSLTIGFSPSLWNYNDLVERIKRFIDKADHIWDHKVGRNIQLPVCYEDDFSLDMEEVMRQTGLSSSDIIDLHTMTHFQVFMVGFLPGFAYLGTVPDQLYCERRNTPRLKVPAQSVALAGQQSGIYPMEAPGGWQIIGRIPFKTFDTKRLDPFLLRVGDRVKFYPVSHREFDSIAATVVANGDEIQKIYA